MPLVLDRDATFLEIDGDQLIILGLQETRSSGERVSSKGRVHVETQAGGQTPHGATTRRTLTTAVAAGADRQADAAGAVKTDEHQRFTDRRAAVAEAAFVGRRRRRGRIVAAGLVLIGAGWALVASPVLRVSDVRVVGLQSLNPQVVLDAVDASEQPSMLTLKVTDIETRLEALPLVHDANVWKQWPDQLVVEVAERYPVATARSGSDWLIIDQRGEVLETRQVRPELPQFDLLGQPVDPSDKTVQALIQVAIGSSPRLRQQIQTLSMSGEGVELRLRPGIIDNDALVVRFGHVDDVQAKLRALETMLDPTTKAPLDGLSVLDLTVADQPALMRPTTIAAPVLPATTAGTDGPVPGGETPANTPKPASN
jgi:cell division protein FtsQ